MKNRSSRKAIIDAVLKIAKIIKKLTTLNQHSKKSTGDVPVPPPMRTLASYVSGFNSSSMKVRRVTKSSCKHHQYGSLLSNNHDRRQYYTKRRQMKYDHHEYSASDC